MKVAPVSSSIVDAESEIERGFSVDAIDEIESIPFAT